MAINDQKTITINRSKSTYLTETTAIMFDKVFVRYMNYLRKEMVILRLFAALAEKSSSIARLYLLNV